jgi:hypothetical protein
MEKTMTKQFAFPLSLLLLFFTLQSCKKPTPPKPRNPKTKKQMQKQTTPTFSHWWFSSPKDAFQAVLQTQPTILGIGEIHQVQRQKHITSAIKRFTKQLLPSTWGASTDLIVETWVTTGQCGRTETRITKQVKRIIKRPKKTENQIVTLLRSAKHLGIQPHVLTVHCKTYEQLMAHRGNARTRQLILLVTRLLLQKTREVFKTRKQNKQRASIIIYGGALHNDLYPDPQYEHFSYVPKLLKQIKANTHTRFVELDLYVPEYLDDDTEWKTKPWYKLYLQQQKTKKTLLIKRKKYSYILLFPWTQKTKKMKKPTKR